jgi:nitroimidazol reductase NimA-like FMN-containing flavoprotein (pyridoxamine 5'-phosphate oxidase superfamily)
MVIHDMSRQMSIDFLGDTRIGHLACSHGTQSYVTPFSYAYHENFIYSFATVGRKVEWMRANPLVCVEVERIVNREEWRTVVIFGRFQELHNSRELPDLREFAHSLLSREGRWWEPGYAKTLHWGVERKLEAIYFRISIEEITGHQAFADEPVDGSGSVGRAARQTPSW